MMTKPKPRVTAVRESRKTNDVRFLVTTHHQSFQGHRAKPRPELGSETAKSWAEPECAEPAVQRFAAFWCCAQNPQGRRPRYLLLASMARHSFLVIAILQLIRLRKRTVLRSRK